VTFIFLPSTDIFFISAYSIIIYENVKSASDSLELLESSISLLRSAILMKQASLRFAAVTFITTGKMMLNVSNYYQQSFTTAIVIQILFSAAYNNNDSFVLKNLK